MLPWPFMSPPKQLYRCMLSKQSFVFVFHPPALLGTDRLEPFKAAAAAVEATPPPHTGAGFLGWGNASAIRRDKAGIVIAVHHVMTYERKLVCFSHVDAALLLKRLQIFSKENSDHLCHSSQRLPGWLFLCVNRLMPGELLVGQWVEAGCRMLEMLQFVLKQEYSMGTLLLRQDGAAVFQL